MGTRLYPFECPEVDKCINVRCPFWRLHRIQSLKSTIGELIRKKWGDVEKPMLNAIAISNGWAAYCDEGILGTDEEIDKLNRDLLEIINQVKKIKKERQCLQRDIKEDI